MRRTNLITLLSMVILLTVATVLIFFGEKPSVRAGTEKYNNTFPEINR